MASIHDFTMPSVSGEPTPLANFAGRVLLIVNTASRCGFTGQYAGLRDLQERFGPRGFSVLAFPCDQFGGQEPGTEAEIDAFCATTFGINFPLFGKIRVNGPETAPLYQYLRAEKPGLGGRLLGGSIGWNFTKFLVGRDGTVLGRFAPVTKPADLAEVIEEALETPVQG